MKIEVLNKFGFNDGKTITYFEKGIHEVDSEVAEHFYVQLNSKMHQESFMELKLQPKVEEVKIDFKVVDEPRIKEKVKRTTKGLK